MKKLVVTAFVVLLVIGALQRACDVIIYPIGSGRREASPNGKFQAHAGWLYDESFWGFSHHWYEFEVRGKDSGKVLAAQSVDVPAGQPVCEWRGEGTIEWTPDSSTVRFLAEDGAVLCTLHVSAAR